MEPRCLPPNGKQHQRPSGRILQKPKQSVRFNLPIFLYSIPQCTTIYYRGKSVAIPAQCCCRYQPTSGRSSFVYVQIAAIEGCGIGHLSRSWKDHRSRTSHRAIMGIRQTYYNHCPPCSLAFLFSRTRKSLYLCSMKTKWNNPFYTLIYG